MSTSKTTKVCEKSFVCVALKLAESYRTNWG